MNKPEEKYRRELAWLQLVHTRGIGPKRAWGIYHQLRDSDLSVTDIFIKPRGDIPTLKGISSALHSRLHETSLPYIEKRHKYLQQSSVRLLYPGSDKLELPEIPGLPPMLTLWGDFQLLNAPRTEVLLKSRDTDSDCMTSFLQAVARGEMPRKNWCFCPFSKIDWELAESLLKLKCGVVLGLVSGISRRVMTLAREFPDSRIVAFSPEPPLRSRRAIFGCLEAFYRLFIGLSNKILLLHVRQNGNTARRIKYAAQEGCEITQFGSTTGEQREPLPVIPQRSSNPRNIQSDHLADEDDDRFITCL